MSSPVLPTKILVFAQAEDSRGGASAAARLARALDERGFDIELTVRGVDPAVRESVRQSLSTLARREVTVLPATDDRLALIADLRATDLLIMPGQTGRFGLLGLEAVMHGVPVIAPADSGIGLYLADRQQVPSELRPPLIAEEYGQPIPVERWVEQLDSVLSDLPAIQADALRLQQHVLQRNKTWDGAAATLAAIARYTDAVEGLIAGRARQPLTAPVAAPGADAFDPGLYYEAAVDILGSLMAAYAASEWLAEHGGPRDLVTPAAPVGPRGDYLGAIARLNPADPQAITEAIRVYGEQLAALGATTAVRPRTDPERFQLARGDHQWVFLTKIAPELYGNLTAATDPTAVIVIGPPGSGKTTAIQSLREERPDAAVIDPELLFTYHPRAWDLTVADDPRAGDIVMWDAMGWTALAVEHAGSARADILLELTTEKQATEFALALREWGYRVELQTMAAPAALSTLHASLRFHCRHGNWQVLGTGLTAGG
ncbi:zeta toxin family protein [Nocardia sp. NPDC055321]